MSALAARIEARAPELSARVVEEMYRNPFWLERFGERGRQFATQDGDYHLTYLVQALTADDPRVLTGYARWLQPVLTTRGMCTRHIDDNFARLARAIAEDVGDAGRAIELLDAARAALLYDAGAARQIQDASPRVAEAAVLALYAQRPAWQERWGDAGRARCADDLRYHLSYLADAIALDRPAVFTDYLTWIEGFLQRRGIDAAHLRDMLQAMRDADPVVAAALERMTR